MPAIDRGRLVHHRYEVIETVGHGGESVVLKARDTRHDRLVALKVRHLPAYPADEQRILAEVRTLLDLPAHPGLPVARDDFFEEDRHVLVMDWIDGIDLARVLVTDGAPGLPRSTVARWAAQAADALTHLHRHDPPIVHGDVKPSNLILDRRGRIVCVDYGVSSVPGRAHRGGTPGFRAPELGVPTPAADVYGLAATVFALLTGEPPRGVLPEWSGMTADEARRVEVAIRRGLSLEPGRRSGSVGELVESLSGDSLGTLPTGTVTVLSTSITGATALWEQHPRSMPGALARHDVIVDRAIERHGGQRVHGALEDGATVSVFARAVHAVLAAVEVNGELAGACEPAIAVSAGAHTGQLSERDARGPTVNRAVAVRAIAAAGQVLVSEATSQLLLSAPTPGVELVALGPHRLPGIDEPERVHAVAAAGLDVPPDPAIPPYPGLVSLSLADADVFMGRDDEVAALLALIEQGRLTTILGASGVGKSSVLHAGVRPHLPDPVVCEPGGDPIAVVRQAGQRIVVIDQFEEVLGGLRDGDEQAALVELLTAHPGGAVIAVRTDAIDQLARFPRLAQEIADRHVLLTPMRASQLRIAVQQPALRRGLELEPGLVELIIAEVGDGSGSLPLVAHAMRETWARRDGRTLTVQGYTESGGVRGAIASSAEGVYDQLDEAGRELCRDLLLRMVRPGGDGTPDTRRRVQIGDLRSLATDAPIDEIVEQLTASRLLVRDGSWVQPTHDALLRAWPRLAEWIAERRDLLRRQAHLTSSAGAWAASDGDPAELYRGARLAAAADLATRSNLTDGERAFVDASLRRETEEQQRVIVANRRLRRLLASVAVALVVAMTAGIVAAVQLRRAADQRDRADEATDIGDVTRLAAEARAVAPTSPDLALLLGVQAQRRLDSAETRSALLEALTAHPLLVAKLHGVTSGLEAVSWSPDGAVLAAPTSDSTGTLLWDTTSFEPTGELLDPSPGFRLGFDASFSPDGATLLVAGVVEQRVVGVESATAVLEVWDVASRALRTSVSLDVVPDAVLAVDHTRAIVVGQPVPPDVAATIDDTAVVQSVDLLTGTAAAPEVLAAAPLAIGSNGAMVVALTPDRGLVVLDAAAGARPASVDVRAVLGADDVPISVGISASGRELAIGTASGETILAEITSDDSTTRLIRRIDAAGDATVAIGFSPDGSLVALGGYLGSTTIHDAASGRPYGPALTGFAGLVNDLEFSPDGRRLAAGGADGTGAVWALDGTRSIGTAIAGHRDALVAALATPDGQTIVTAGLDGIVTARDASSGAERWRVDVSQPIVAAALDGTGTRLAIGGADGRLAVHAVADGGRETGRRQFAGPVVGVAWSPREPQLAVAALPAPDEPPAGLQFVDTETLSTVGEVSIPGGTPIAAAYSPDGRQVAMILDNNVVRLVDPATGDVDDRFLESVDAPFLAVAWSPLGERLATGTTAGTVQIWDVETLQRATPAGRQHVEVRGLAFSPDGDVLASTSALGTTQLWRTATGAPIGGQLVGGPVPPTIDALATDDRPAVGFVPSFAPAGDVLYVAGDHPMRWTLDVADWLAAACGIAGRELSITEQTRYLPGRVPTSTCTEAPTGD